MADMNKVRSIMPLGRAMAMYGTSDKEKFQCAYPEWEAKRPDTTFYADFSVADVYGEQGILDTYKRCFDGWKDNAKYFTEFVGALNHKLWYWYEAGIEEYSQLYDKLWKEADAYGSEHFKDEDAQHYFSVLD